MKIIDIARQGYQYSDLFLARKYLLEKMDSSGGASLKESYALDAINKSIEWFINNLVSCAYEDCDKEKLYEKDSA